MTKALIVDDDKLILALAEGILKAEGKDVITCDDGREVAHLIESEQPDIVIIDIFMPEVDGIENIRNIRGNNPELPIIAISSEKKYLQAAEKFGANISVCKPFDGALLLSLVDSLT